MRVEDISYVADLEWYANLSDEDNKRTSVKYDDYHPILEKKERIEVKVVDTWLTKLLRKEKKEKHETNRD